MINEIEKKVCSGGKMLIVSVAILIFSIFSIGVSSIFGIITAILFILWIISLSGFFTLQPNEAAVLILFGSYKGTVRNQDGIGFPFYVKKRVSLRLRNLKCAVSKVNDQMGNPIEIASSNCLESC